jgi:hypothetical protein
LIFGLLSGCVALQHHYEDPWSILDKKIIPRVAAHELRPGCLALQAAVDQFFDLLIVHMPIFDSAGDLRKAPLDHRPMLGVLECKFACNNDPLRGDFRVQFRPL